MKQTAYLLVNFGGPRNEQEIEPFLKALLTDQDVMRTRMPPFLHRILFTRIAKKRALKVTKDYATIGGKSPIFADTEAIAERLREIGASPLLTFHRYLPDTHDSFLKTIQTLEAEEIRVFPLFPQFTYATTGSCARWFETHLPQDLISKFRWIKSYPCHPSFILAHHCNIRNFLHTYGIPEKETLLLFSAHGIPEDFVLKGDIYRDECQASFHAVMQGFPDALGLLCYQSQFGKGEWLKPYTLEVCRRIDQWRNERSHILFVPISFTSDHIETLFEIEQEYMSLIKAVGLSAWRIPALTLNPEWIEAIAVILRQGDLCNNQMLVRRI